MTTLGGIAGIKLGRLLGWEHASTPQSGVEAPRLNKSLTRLYFCELPGRKINFTDSKTLVGVATNRDARFL